jgi:hypothetical protein
MSRDHQVGDLVHEKGNAKRGGKVISASKNRWEVKLFSGKVVVLTVWGGQGTLMHDNWLRYEDSLQRIQEQFDEYAALQAKAGAL